MPSLSILNDSNRDLSTAAFRRFEAESVIERLKSLSRCVREHGVASLKPDEEPLIRLGMEIDGDGNVTKSLLGVFDLSWQAQEHPEWAGEIVREVEAVRSRLQQAHGVPLRFLIWAGMGGSIEDKLLYHAAGLLKGGPTFYALDSTDPAKLKAIIHDMQVRSGAQLPEILRATLVVGMALGMTSYEPVLNLQKLAKLYDDCGVASEANFLYMTLDGSLLDQFAAARGYTRVPLQPDNRNTTAGRHSSPLTRGSLYPLASAHNKIDAWIGGTFLSPEEISVALRLGAFLHQQGVAGRDQVTLLLPKSWAAAGLWTKQDFEESLGKRETLGLKIVIGERVRPRHYHRAGDAGQHRVFLVIQRKAEAHPEAEGITSLRHGGYPLAIATFDAHAPLSRYMQFMHYVVFAIAYLREMNFVTQPGVELYKSIASEIFDEARQKGGIEKTAAWSKIPRDKELWEGVMSIAPKRYAALLGRSKARYAELTYFGDMRYSPEGQAMRACLDRAANRVFRMPRKMPVDIYEGPAMNHSYHEMIIGHGGCFSTVLLSEKQSRFPAAGYDPDYHMAQFLATKTALERRHRDVVALTIQDTSEKSLETLDNFFREVAALG